MNTLSTLCLTLLLAFGFFAMWKRGGGGGGADVARVNAKGLHKKEEVEVSYDNLVCYL